MIHATAIVDPAAKLAADVEVGPYSVIGAQVEIAGGTEIGPHVVISGPSRIGRDNRIFQFASVGEAPQDLKYKGEPTWLEIGDRNVIREYVTLNRGTEDGHGKTVIGCDNLFMAYSHVAHDCIVGSHCIFANAASLAGHVEVGDFTTLGGFTSVHQFTHIGTRAFCGLGSVITQDIPPFSIAAGNRAKVVGINKEGLKRRGYAPEAIRALQDAFKILVKSKHSHREAVEKVSEIAKQFDEVKYLLDFLSASERGWIR